METKKTDIQKQEHISQRILSKSQVNMFLQCPLKWKYCDIDGNKSEPSPAQLRGINIHRKIEKVYNKMKLVKKDGQAIPEIQVKVDEELEYFMDFEKKRIFDCVNEKGEFDMKYFRPLHQEMRITNPEMKMRGIIDAVYINPKDDGLIIVDWKSGKYYKNKLDDYRFELSIYSELLRATGRYDDIKYWAIYFTDQDKLFFEKIEMEHIIKMYNTVSKVREEMGSGVYPKKYSFWCKYCQFKEKCKDA